MGLSDDDSVAISKISYRSILAFHKLTDRFTYGSINVSPSRLSTWLRKLQKHGYKFCSLSSQLKIESPDSKAIAFVFDDGYAHLAKTLPLLIREFSLRPAIALPTYYINSANRWDYSSLIRTEHHLSKSEIVKLAEMGVQFVSHSHTHVALTDCTETKLVAELTRSKEILENLINKPVTTISYPFGAVNSKVIDRALAAGYTHGLTMNHPTLTDDPMQIGRYGIHCFDSYSSVVSYLKRKSPYKFYKAASQFTSFLANGTRLLQKLRGGRVTK